MPPDAAERLVSVQPSDPRLRIDFEVVAATLQGSQLLMAVRPIAVALVTGAAGDTAYYQESYVSEYAKDDSTILRSALNYLGPERADVRLPEQPTGYPIEGIAPGLSLGSGFITRT